MSRKQRRAQEAVGRKYNEKMNKVLSDVKSLAQKVFGLEAAKLTDIDVVMGKVEAGVVVAVQYNKQVYAQVAAPDQDTGLVKLRETLRKAKPPSIESKMTERGIIQTIG